MAEMTMKESALYYERMGLAVFPLAPRSKKPLTHNGCKDATTDPGQIDAWWNRWPDANIGIATGSKSGGLVVIDLDIDEDKGVNGYEVLTAWQREHGTLPDTAMSITGRGGYHYLYRDAAQWKNRAGLYEGVDIRGEGGYIVAPPSIHPNGRRYEWEQNPSEYGFTSVNDKVIQFLSPAPKEWDKPGFQCQAEISEGKRTAALISLIGSLKGKCLPNEAIMAAVIKTNEGYLPPLTDEELEKTVFPALKNLKEGSAPYYQAVSDKGIFRPVKNHSLDMTGMDNVQEKAPDWLIMDYMPRYQITSLAGDGGSGKTTLWCAIAAAVSSGRKAFLESFLPEDWGNEGIPQIVMFFSAEDSYEYTLKRRLRKNGAKLENIYSIDIADERFPDVKFNSPFLEQLIDKYRPALCIFDPIQAFVPPDIRMGDRNAMRACLSPLIGYGEKYGTTFLIIEHANKQSGVWGRKRIADSADIWDISRSVIMAGETNEAGVRYLSHEKSNYGPTGNTVLYTIKDEVIEFKGYSTKKDKDFVTDVDYTTRQAPQKEEAKEFILEFLQDGEKEVSELDAMANAQGITKATLTRAKAELKKDGQIRYRNEGSGKNGDKKFYISLTGSLSSIATEKVSE